MGAVSSNGVPQYTPFQAYGSPGLTDLNQFGPKPIQNWWDGVTTPAESTFTQSMRGYVPPVDMTGGGFTQAMQSLSTPQLASLWAGSGSPTKTPSMWDGFLGTKNADGSQTQGWGGLAFGAAQGLGSLYMGMKQYGLGKQQLAFQQDSFNKNFEVQKQMTNSQLEDRQRSRVASNSGAYQSVGDYMKQNGVA